MYGEHVLYEVDIGAGDGIEYILPAYHGIGVWLAL